MGKSGAVNPVPVSISSGLHEICNLESSPHIINNIHISVDSSSSAAPFFSFVAWKTKVEELVTFFLKIYFASCVDDTIPSVYYIKLKSGFQISHENFF